MRLAEYIKKHGDAHCAAMWGVKVRTTAGWRRGERTPRPAQARLIVSTTGGEVSLAEIYSINPFEKVA
ncbi:MAG: hypothetical protein KGI54_16675 [Pseudomonadota bacterium]|nr:hypothetical protein [Pseudomonadota bacterium]